MLTQDHVLSSDLLTADLWRQGDKSFEWVLNKATAARAACWQACRQLRGRIARREAMTDLDDGLLRDIGVIRECDIGVSSDAARRQADKLFWLP
jgi:uncharacterized protein YjiS (DUF1127 family)